MGKRNNKRLGSALDKFRLYYEELKHKKEIKNTFLKKKPRKSFLANRSKRKSTNHGRFSIQLRKVYNRLFVLGKRFVEWIYYKPV